MHPISEKTSVWLPVVREYFFNGAYSYAIFGFYALTIAPFVTEFIEFRQANAWIGVFGLAMLIAEFFAINYGSSG